MENHLITLMVFLPLVGAVIQAVLWGPQEKVDGAGKWVGLITSLISSLCAAVLLCSMHADTPGLQAVESFPWVGSYSIGYEMGIDGLNALLVLLIAVVFPIILASEWNRDRGVRGMHGLFLLLQGALLGAACAQDAFLLFFFWALSALPFYFLIGIWGGEKREGAAFQTMVASTLGNALLFSALLLIYYSIDPHTFLLKDLTGGKFAGKSIEVAGTSLSISDLSFALICGGLALRAPIWPIHGWFVQAAEEAPPSALVALSAVSVPMTAYILIRLGYSLFPETLANWTQALIWAGAINMVMGGVCAISQTNLRNLLAFVCIGELGLVLIGFGSLSQAGMVGASYQSLALGLGLGGFGLFLGIVKERMGHTTITELSGVAFRAPTVALIAGIFLASLLGFPGLGGFVGRSLLVIGSYSVHPLTAVLAAGAIILATYYLFTMYREVFLGGSRASSAFPDLTLRERAYFFPLIGILLFCGIYPKPLLDLVRPTILNLLSPVK